MRNLGVFNNQASSTTSGMKARKASASFASLESWGSANCCWGLGAHTFPISVRAARVSGKTRWLTTIVLEVEACAVMQSLPRYNAPSQSQFLRNSPIFAKADICRVSNHDHGPCDQDISHHLAIEKKLLRIEESAANGAGADHTHNRGRAHVPFKTEKSMDGHRRKRQRQHREAGDG